MLDLLTNAPTETLFGGQRYQIGALKIRELGLLQRWIRDHSIRPTVRAKAECEILDAADHREIKKAAVLAERDWPPRIGTAEGNGLIFGDLDGQRAFLEIFLRKYQDVPDETITEIMKGLSEEDFGALIAVAFGEDGLDPETARARTRERLAELVKALAQETPESTTESSGTS